MRVLGLDVATKTGFAVLQDSDIIDTGIIKLNSKHDYRTRLQCLRNSVLKLLEEHNPDVVALEAVYTTNNRQRQNVKTVALLNQMRGVVVECIPQDIEVVDVYNRTAKKQVMGSGSCTKQQVFDWVVKVYKLKEFTFNKHNDITDAVLVALYAEAIA